MDNESILNILLTDNKMSLSVAEIRSMDENIISFVLTGPMDEAL